MSSYAFLKSQWRHAGVDLGAMLQVASVLVPYRGDLWLFGHQEWLVRRLSGCTPDRYVNNGAYSNQE
jgi:hypothetical protein